MYGREPRLAIDVEYGVTMPTLAFTKASRDFGAALEYRTYVLNRILDKKHCFIV